ncbi:MAG: helicase-related protein, partial [Oceanicaulis sp.]
MTGPARGARPGAKITAVLGPTNTGKTHLALERMMARGSGVMGLPLRLLARELYDRVVKAKGAHAVALITGEEKIRPPTARYFLCTVEAMPMDLRPAFVGVDEIQLCADPERGHVFTDRLLNARGTEETMLMGAATMRPLIRRLVPDAEIEERERFSVLTYAGPKKLSKLPRRSAIVAFSAEDVYSIAELVRRQRGGAAVVMGALSPRTRNSQVALYQSGEVDFLIATDAIGMGLNMDVDHVAFASLSKFDGRKRRKLYPQEIGQIAGRAGRFRSDGTFGVTADARPPDPDVIERVENHEFEPVTKLTWRNTDLDLSSLHALRASLNALSPDPALERVRYAVDEEVLDICARDAELKERLKTRAGVARLWDVCGTPDFRKTTIDDHSRLVKTLFGHLTSGNGRLPDAWLDAQISRLARTSGDVDALSQRLAHVRTW